jgi:hypothetical protein
VKKLDSVFVRRVLQCMSRQAGVSRALSVSWLRVPPRIDWRRLQCVWVSVCFPQAVRYSSSLFPVSRDHPQHFFKVDRS